MVSEDLEKEIKWAIKTMNKRKIEIDKEIKWWKANEQEIKLLYQSLLF